MRTRRVFRQLKGGPRRAILLPATLLMAAGMCLAAAPTAGPSSISVPRVVITLIDRVEVPARETGVLQEVLVTEGDLVDAGALLARLQDDEARIAADRAMIEVEKALKEAGSSVRVEAARKGHEVANAELQRAEEAITRFARSISESELDRLRLTAEQARLQTLQAEEDRKMAALTARLCEKDLDLSIRDVERRKLVSPLRGVVVQVNRKTGEWVKPGDPVCRIVRTDRLRVEGFVHVSQIDPTAVGSTALLQITDRHGRSQQHEGVLVFISPEANPVNGQVRIWAEIDNTAGTLRPGLGGSMEIFPGRQPQLASENTSAPARE
ncbi:MAG: HlyD family efflux transporter periplasmic adaptor subunit [Planctomycetaceae bacterium]|nr:HlyD family efflux transporter periplasmic adaptor subunit [Planctomycetaceae bacterium]